MHAGASPGEASITIPKLIVDVLSPSTAGADRYQKRFNYQWIPTLQAYVTIALDIAEIALNRKEDDWRPITHVEPQAAIELHSIGLALPLARLYAGESM